MKANVIKMIVLNIFLFGILAVQSCKKDAQLSKTSEQGYNDSTAFATSALTSSYVVSTFAGGNPGNVYPIPLPYPSAICSAADGLMFVAGSNKIFKLTKQGGYSLYLNYENPGGVKAGANGSIYFLSNFRSTDGSVDTIAIVKADKNKKITIIPVKEKLSQIIDLAIGPDSSFYLPDNQHNRILKVTKQGVVTVLAGKYGINGYADGKGENAHFTYPTYVKFGEDGNVWVVDGTVFNTGQSIRKISMDGTVTTLYRLKPDYKNYTHIDNFAVTKRDKNFNLSSHENVFFFLSSYTNGNRITSNQLFHLSYDKVLTPITGRLPEGDNYQDGPASQASFNGPGGMTINPNGIFVADAISGAIRRIARQ